MAKSKSKPELEDLLRMVSDEDERTFQLGDKHLPFLFRALYKLSDKWLLFSTQLGLNRPDDIAKDGRACDDCLVLALQRWLKEGEVTWKKLIEAIYQPAGGANPVLANRVASSFKELCTFKPTGHAQATSTDDICPDNDLIHRAVGELQGVMGNKVAAYWYQKGTVLGAPVEELEIIRRDTPSATECQMKMLRAWLMYGANTTWQWLVDSIEHGAGGKHAKLAKDISELHPLKTTSQAVTEANEEEQGGGPEQKNEVVQTVRAAWSNRY
jgi:hypothetical protein